MSEPPNAGSSVSEPSIAGMSAIRMPSEFISVTPLGKTRSVRINRQHIIHYGYSTNSAVERVVIQMRDGLTHTVIDSMETLDALLIGNPDD
jgi:hypothetical protein